MSTASATLGSVQIWSGRETGSLSMLSNFLYGNTALTMMSWVNEDVLKKKKTWATYENLGTFVLVYMFSFSNSPNWESRPSGRDPMVSLKVTFLSSNTSFLTFGQETGDVLRWRQEHRAVQTVPNSLRSQRPRLGLHHEPTPSYSRWPLLLFFLVVS